MEEEQKQLVYISDKSSNNNILDEQKKYIENKLNYETIDYFFVIHQGFCYTTFTSFSNPIMITSAQYDKFISYFKDEETKIDDQPQTNSRSYEINKLFNGQKCEMNDLKNIQNNKLLKHKLVNIHKVELVKYLKKNKKIYLLDTNYKDLILNNHLPYLIYDDLKEDLKELYKDENFERSREGEKRVLFDQLIKAVNYARYLSENEINFVLLVINKNLLIIYHPYDELEIDYQEGKEGENYKEIIEFLFGEEMENIIDKKLPLADEKDNVKNFDFVNSLDNYIIDNINPEYKISLSSHVNTRDKNKKICNNNIDFDIIYQYRNLGKILIKYKDKELVLTEDFYIPEKDDNLDRMATNLNSLWVNGYLMGDYEYNFYIRFDKILFNDIYLPKWFVSKNNEDLNILFRFIEQL